jgi:hypothetical protein
MHSTMTKFRLNGLAILNVYKDRRLGIIVVDNEFTTRNYKITNKK